MNSQNLYIRPSVFSDCTLFTEWELQPHIKRFFTIDATYNYEKVVKDFVYHDDDSSHIQFTIIYKHNNKPIGRIWISRLDTINKSLDITRIYIGDSDYSGKGYGKEAMILLLQYCFDILKMHRVSLDYFTGNKVAKSLYEKLGFQPEGVLRNCVNRDGDWYDLNLMSILRHEYEYHTLSLSV